jgi:aspartyl-tRNA(Asn)/glutamyl-tRNA(Gln) amidotransferase subunit A
LATAYENELFLSFLSSFFILVGERGMKRTSSIYGLSPTIEGLSKLISSKDLSPVDLIGATLDQINILNPELNAFITVLEDFARTEAKKAESQIIQGKYKGPLHGIPISLKDLIYVRGVRSTSGSKILSDYIPQYDSTVVKKLSDAGAIIIGMNNTHEFASGITNINPHYGSSKNPWDSTRMSGGSSGGSAVAVSARMSSASIGTDTSGSIRVPSSLCGLFGLKPSYGRVSKYGVMQLAPSIDHVGPITRSAWDAAAVLSVIAGHDELDSSTINYPVQDYLSVISKNKERTTKFKLGIPEEFFFDLIDQDVINIFDTFIDKIHESGISTNSVNVEETDKIYETWRAIRLGESAAVHSEWMKTRREEYGSDVLAMLEKGMDISAVDYITAQANKLKLKSAFLKSMKDLDGLVVPTTPISAPLLDQKIVDINGKSLEVYQALSRLTTVFDVTGFPALNIPAGLINGQLPVGVQLVGRPFEEGSILSMGHIYEKDYRVAETIVPPIVRESKSD